MTVAETVAAAAAEGLLLVRADNVSGFRHVVYRKRYNRYSTQVCHRRPDHNILGSCRTAEEAALRVARWFRDNPPAAVSASAPAAQGGATPAGAAPSGEVPAEDAPAEAEAEEAPEEAPEAAEAEAKEAEATEAEAAPAAPPMTTAETLATAAAESLTLLRADIASGFRFVSYRRVRRTFYARKPARNSQEESLGGRKFATAEEEALHVARSPAGRAAPKAEAEAEEAAMRVARTLGGLAGVCEAALPAPPAAISASPHHLTGRKRARDGPPARRPASYLASESSDDAAWAWSGGEPSYTEVEVEVESDAEAEVVDAMDSNDAAASSAAGPSAVAPEDELTLQLVSIRARLEEGLVDASETSALRLDLVRKQFGII